MVAIEVLMIPGLLAKLWPPERALMGMRVCRSVQAQLTACIESALVSGPSIHFTGTTQTNRCDAQDICNTLSRLRNCKVTLVWNSSRRKLMPILLNGIVLALEQGFGNKLAQLTLNSNKGWDASFQQLATVISSCSAVQRLDLRVGGIKEVGALELSNALRRCVELEHLDLSWSKIKPSGAIALATAVRHCTALTHLGLAGNDVQDAGLILLAPAIQQCIKLQHLHLECNHIGSSGASALGGALEHLGQLSTLNMSRNSIDDSNGVPKFCRGLAHCSALTSLDLHQNQMTTVAVVAALANCTALTMLELGDNFIGPEGAEQVSRVLGRCERLAHVGLYGTRMLHAGVVNLNLGNALQRCRGLTFLNVGHNIVGNRGVQVLAETLPGCEQLTRLDLSRNRIGDGGLDALVLLVQSCPSLRSLDLAENELEDEGGAGLAEAVRGTDGLVNLNLSHNSLGDVAAVRFAEVLPECGLVSLALSANRVRHAGEAALLAAAARLIASRGCHVQVGSAYTMFD